MLGGEGGGGRRYHKRVGIEGMYSVKKPNREKSTSRMEDRDRDKAISYQF